MLGALLVANHESAIRALKIVESIKSMTGYSSLSLNSLIRVLRICHHLLHLDTSF